MVNITPLSFTPDSVHQEYSLNQEALIPSILSSSLFNPGTDYIVVSLETLTGDLLYSSRNVRYAIRDVPNTITQKSTPEVLVFPSEDLENSSYSEGDYNIFYNFYRTALESDKNLFFIKDISPSRTEIRISVNSLDDKKIESLFNEFKTLLDEGSYFKDFYINIGDYYYIAVNTQLDNSTSPYTILFKLYQPLPSEVELNDQVQVVFETAETYGFNISTPIIPINFDEDIEYIKGPNFNLSLDDQVNNSTFEQDYNSLTNTSLTSSYNQIQNILNQKGVTIDTDYTDFSNFIHFSSAQQRLLNFVYKVGLIESYNSDINLIRTITGSTSSSLAVTASIQNIQNQITDLIKNFDGYENFLYYTSGTYAYPKSNSTPPYILQSTGSAGVLTWLGNASSTGILYSALLYDEQNQNYLYNTVPKYLREDPINVGYELFISMVGQHFDNLYVYIDAITDRYDADNRLNYGIPKELVADALRSMGIKLYQNNFSSDDLYAAFLGINGSGSFLPPTGSEIITNYVTASNEPIPLNNLNLETYKRLYHNLPYLLKKKGTVEGLRALINIFGIPDTILRISEFGGKNKDNSNDWDYFQNKFNYALYNSGSTTTSRVSGDWSLNTLWGSLNNMPGALALRFKPSSLPTSENHSLLFTIWDNSNSSKRGYLTLSYTGSSLSSGSYSGSIPSSSKDYATLRYWNETNEFMSVDAPFYNGNWWSVLVERSSTDMKLYVAEKIYDGNDGFKIGYTASDTYTGGITTGWATGTAFYLPSSGSSGITLGSKTYYGLTGSFQELRLYSTANITEEDFWDYTMNPYSIEAVNYSSSANTLAFRAPLGSDLITTTGTRTSIHPKITGSFITNSFVGGSTYNIGTNLTFIPQTEFIYYDQPAVGIRNRVSHKIRQEDNLLPSGNTLSPYRSIQQRYPQSESYTRDINYVEVAFSPQNEINDDINSSMGYFNIGEYIGDPRQVSESTYSYPNLDKLRDSYFSKYFKNYNWNDYIRLIKYFDNSLFKMIKDFTPARSGLATGVVIKQHLLERNRQRPAQINTSTSDENFSGSIDTAFIEGGTGGIFSEYNDLPLSISSFVSGTRFAPSYSPSTFVNIFSGSNYLTVDGIFSTEPNRGNIGLLPGVAAKYDPPLTFVFEASEFTDGLIATASLSSSLRGTIESLNWAGPAGSSPVSNISVVTFSTIFPLEGEIFEILVKSTGSASTSGQFYNTSLYCLSIPTSSYITSRSGTTVNYFPYTTYPSSNPLENYQVWDETISTKLGDTTLTHTTEDEFYNGELKGTEYEVTNGELGIILDTSLENSIIAYYGQVYKYLDFNTKPGNINRMAYITDSDSRNSNIIGFLFVNEASDIDENPVDLAPYLSSLKFGDILQLRTSGDDQIFEYIVISSTPYTYLSYPGHQVIITPQKATGEWDDLGAEFKNFSVEWIYDPTITDIQNAIKDNEPLQNNVVIPKYSTIYHDADYSTGLIPTNFILLASGTADYAPIQDSNYTATGWANSRYKGSKVWSTDFNI